MSDLHNHPAISLSLTHTQSPAAESQFNTLPAMAENDPQVQFKVNFIFIFLSLYVRNLCNDDITDVMSSLGGGTKDSRE